MTLDQLIAIVWRLLAVAALVFLNGFFVAAEFALVKLRDTQIDPLIRKGHRRAAVARRLVANLDATIGATQLGITLVSLGLGMLVEPVFAALLTPVFSLLHVDSQAVRHAIAIGVGFFINTFLLVVVGELGPKALAIRKTLPTALWTAQPLAWFYRAAFPLIWLLNRSAQWLLRQVGIDPASERDVLHSEEELRLLFSATQRRAAATTLGREIVLNALDLRRRITREVMRPRQEIVGLSTDATIAECIEIAERTRFSRFPLLERGSVDHTRGVIHIKDLYASRHTAARAADLAPLARAIVFVPETARLERLLEFFLQRRVHLAIVVDEYGGTVGLVTLENVIEELVGQIQDEFDQEKPLVTKTGDQTWSVDGSLPVHELSDLVGEMLVEENVTTASGWVTHKLGGFPKVGDVIKLEAFELMVEAMDGPKVARLTIRRRKDIPERSP